MNIFGKKILMQSIRRPKHLCTQGGVKRNFFIFPMGFHQVAIMVIKEFSVGYSAIALFSSYLLTLHKQLLEGR
jgi:hypothetical protein